MVSTSFTSVDEREEVSPKAKLEQLGRRGSRVVAMATQETLTLDSQGASRPGDLPYRQASGPPLSFGLARARTWQDLASLPYRGDERTPPLP